MKAEQAPLWLVRALERAAWWSWPLHPRIYRALLWFRWAFLEGSFSREQRLAVDERRHRA